MVVVVTVVFGFVYPWSLAGRLPQQGAFIYYCASFRLCLGGQAALASAGINQFSDIDCSNKINSLTVHIMQTGYSVVQKNVYIL